MSKYRHTLTHTHVHSERVISSPTCFAHSRANDFQHIYNYCKCVQNFRPYTPIHPRRPLWVGLHTYIVLEWAIRDWVSVCLCAKWTFDFTGCCFLPVFFLLPLVSGGGCECQKKMWVGVAQWRGSEPQGFWGSYTALWVFLLVVLGIWILFHFGFFFVHFGMMFASCPVSISRQSHLVKSNHCLDRFHSRTAMVHHSHLSNCCWSGPGHPHGNTFAACWCRAIYYGQDNDASASVFHCW